jgi:hypothetical protein
MGRESPFLQSEIRDPKSAIFERKTKRQRKR